MREVWALVRLRRKQNLREFRASGGEAGKCADCVTEESSNMSSSPEHDLSLSRRSLTSSKLDEAFQAHGQSGHRFVKKTFTRPSYCHHCTSLLWGLTNQGVICEVCNFVSHERCMHEVVTACVSIASSLVQNPVSHSWSGTSFYKRRFCNVCRKRLEDSVAVRCQVCDYYVHEECKQFSVSDCKQCTTYTPVLGQFQMRHCHHWREGNLMLSAKCVHCKRSCATLECLSSVRCSWCGQTAHTECHLMLPKECTFGYLHKLVLPPFAVSMPNIALWKSCLQTKGESTMSQKVCASEEDDGIEADNSRKSTSEIEKCEVDAEQNSLQIYNGDVNAPRSRKDLSIPRTAQVDQVLEEALKQFHITDDPSNYYLSRTVGENSERPLGPEELPLQFPETRSPKPFIFLRMKSADRRKGYIRIYPGMLNVAANYKTVPVVATTTAAEVIKVALQKFDLKDEDPDNFSLTELRLSDKVKERRMGYEECPWKRLTDIRKTSVREMKTTRFYLRQNLEPIGSVSICVGELPVNLSRNRYETLLSDILGEIAEFCEISAAFPTYGMVFVTLPAADVAADAVARLKSATLDGKSLYARVLPNVHPETFPSDSQPVLVFVNRKSGGGQGDDMMSAFQRLLNPHQVYNLSDGGPLVGFYVFREVEDFRILVCGGDGTVGWVLTCLDDIAHNLKCQEPPAAIVPLGTGNDLSRVLRWGAGYSSGETPVSLLMSLDQAQKGLLDRWLVMFDTQDGVQTLDNGSDEYDSEVGSTCSGKEDEPNLFTMNNYFGIGIDAELCLDFHLRREESPDKFNSRLHNKGVYFRAGLRKFVRKSSRPMQEDIELEVDGKKIELPAVEGIVLLNISSWASGTDAWGPDRDDDFTPSCLCDGLLEVFGVTGVMHMGQIQSGMRYGIRIAQGAQINVKIKAELPVQIDGEPWMQPPGHVIVRPALTQAVMLTKRKVKPKQSQPQVEVSSQRNSHPKKTTAIFYDE